MALYLVILVETRTVLISVVAIVVKAVLTTVAVVMVAVFVGFEVLGWKFFGLHQSFFIPPHIASLVVNDWDVVVTVVPQKVHTFMKIAMQLLHRAANQGLVVEFLRRLLRKRLFSSFQVKILESFRMVISFWGEDIINS